MLIVQKFGGSSVADVAKIARVAGIIADTYSAGNRVVVVLSAQGDTTDELIEKAHAVNPSPGRRELDMLLTVGEQISVALMAMELERFHLPAVSLTGWQAGLKTDSSHGAARIETIDTERIHRELDRGRIVLVAGFQGVDREGDVTTLGRGGSDTTAAALAAALHADRCQIFTDVEGIYTADPRKIPGAEKLDAITYDEMLELASAGSQVLHNRAVELAKHWGVELEVLSSYVPKPGTTVKEAIPEMERRSVSGVTKDADIARITVAGASNQPGTALHLFRALCEASIPVDLILPSSVGGGTAELSFIVPAADAEAARSALQSCSGLLDATQFHISKDVAKVSVVGIGLVGTPSIMVKLFEALAEQRINIQTVSSSELKLSVFLSKADADAAVAAVHRKLFEH